MLGTKEQRTEGMKRQSQELIDHAYDRGFKAGYDKAFATLNENWQLVTSEAEEKGRNEAWGVAKKIFNDEVPLSIFGLFDIHECIVYSPLNSIQTMTASEAIEKLKEYEEQKQEEDDKIKVGDEVILRWRDARGAVIDIDETEMPYKVMLSDGSAEWFTRSMIDRKTGRHFPEITEVLKKMQEDNE